MTDFPTLDQIIMVIDEYKHAEDKVHRLHRYHHDLLIYILNNPDERPELIFLKETIASMIQTYNMVMIEERKIVGVPDTRLELGRPRKTIEELTAHAVKAEKDDWVTLARAGKFDDLPLYLDHATTARVFGVKERTLYDWVQDGVIQQEKDPGRRLNRYHRDEIKRVYIDGGKGRNTRLSSQTSQPSGPARTGMWARKGRNMDDPTDLTASELKRRREEALAKPTKRRRSS